MNRCLRTLVLLALATGVASLNLLLVPAAEAQAPKVTTLPASGVTATNATLGGTVNPNGLVTTAYYQYGLDTNYGDIGSFAVLPATNGNLAMPSFVVNGISGEAGYQWPQSCAPSTNWTSIASSADGVRLAAVVSGGAIYTSTNSGVTWTQSSAPSTNWYSIASSADGTHLAAGASGIYISTNSGLMWTRSSAPSGIWYSIASSADGTHLAAVAAQYGGGIYTSTNSGVTWTQSSAPSENWTSIASSADGTRLAVIDSSFEYIWISTNSGLMWTRSSAPNEGWRAIALSADGMRLAAVDNSPGYIWTSTNSGASWTQSSAPSGRWYSIASSADGTRLAAVDGSPGYIWTSTNSGVTWTQSSATFGEWIFITSSADGTHLAAGVDRGGIYTSVGALSGLTPGTIYHYRLVGLNSAETALGADMAFTTPVGPPTAATLPASGVTATNATLNATVNTGGLNTAEFFEYGLDTNYGNLTMLDSLAATNTTLSVSSLIPSLSPGTTYQFQIVGFNSEGTSLGADMTFTTQPLAPVVTTLVATSVTASNATLNGTVNPGDGITTAYFQYGLDTNYGEIGPFTVLSATNATLAMPSLVVNGIPSAALSSAPSENWQSIASSAGGTHLAAVIGGGGIYSSTNSGFAWTWSSAPSTNWASIASSADGTRLAAVASDGGIYTSTNSSFTWTQSSAPTQGWSSIASSADGTRLAAVSYGVGIYTSTNGGGTWTPSLPSFQVYWSSIASSADGMRLAAVNQGGDIFTSTNAGGTWTPSSAPGEAWISIASSADGTRLAAVELSLGYIWTSADGGVTWTQSSAPSAGWSSIGSSADGTQLAAVIWGGGIYTSAEALIGLTPNTTYHYRLVGRNSAGITFGADQTFTTAAQTANPFTLSGSAPLAVGRNSTFQLRFTNLSGLSFTVLTTTNLRSAMSNWTVLGAPVETPPGQYQFNDPQSTNRPQSFYRVRSP